MTVTCALIQHGDKLTAERVGDRVNLRVETAPDQFTILNLSTEEARKFGRALSDIARESQWHAPATANDYSNQIGGDDLLASRP
jgi:hypothetical protein